MCWQKEKAFVLTWGALIHICTSLSVLLARTENETTSINLCNIYVRRPQPVSLHRSITVMEWIDTCYWKLPCLCGVERDPCHCGKTICPQLQFQRINFHLSYIKSIPVRRVDLVYPPPPGSSSVLELRVPRNKHKQKDVSYLCQCLRFLSL